jgi:hypothetical protein
VVSFGYLLWFIVWRVVVIFMLHCLEIYGNLLGYCASKLVHSYKIFGTNYRPRLQESGCSEMSLSNHHYSLYDNPEGRSSQICKTYKLLYTSGYVKK